MKVERQYLNGISNRKLKTTAKNDFVERLSHDLYAIQIPRLKMQARTEVEQMLDVFNQNKYKTSDKHVLEYTGDMSNPNVQRMVKHLNRALITDDYDLLHQMLVEDEIENLLESKDQEHEEAIKEAVKDAVAEKDEALRAKTQAEQAKSQALADKENAVKVAELEKSEKEYWKALFEAEKQKNKNT